MKKGDELFVYGTLRRGERADLHRSACQFSVEYLGRDKINGKLYSLGPYPGIKLIPSLNGDFDSSLPLVVGDAFYIKDSSVCANLDAYECYNPEAPTQGLYDRTQVVAESGRIVWVYVFNGPVIEDQLIETGDWLNPRLAATHREAPFIRRGA